MVTLKIDNAVEIVMHELKGFWRTRRCNFPFGGCWYQKWEQGAHSRTLGFEYGAAIDTKILSNRIGKTAKHQ